MPSLARSSALRSIRLGALVVACLAVGGCYLSHDRPLDGAPVEHAPRFAGDWRVTAAFGWALLETTTTYRFHDDGRIEVIDHIEGTYFDGHAGQWAFGPPRRDSEARSCSFGATWWSDGERLHIESECTDGAEPVLVLRPAVGSNTGPELVIVAPEGATGFWELEGGPGTIHRCDGDC